MNYPTAPLWITSSVLLAAMSLGCGSSSNVTDAGVTPDVGTTTDSGPTDTGTPDAGTPDAGTPDVGTPDAGTPDTGTPDAGTPDAGPQPERPMRVAYVDYTAQGRARLWVQRPDGSERRQLSFAGVTDEIPGQDPNAPEVTDDHVRSVHRLAWSPDGVHLALIVSTALDQSEVVVLDVDAGGGSVASANGQYVMPALDWSADGRQLAYVMSTAPRAGGLDLFVTDVTAHRWRRVTTGANLRGLAVQLRFAPDAQTVTVTRVEDQGTSAPWDWHTSLLRVDVPTGARPTLETLFVGRVDAMRRDLGAVFAVRNLADDGHSLVAVPTASGGAEAVLHEAANFVSADPTPRDGALVLTSDARTPGSDANAWSYRVLRLPDQSTRVDVPPAVERLAVWVDPAAP